MIGFVIFDVVTPLSREDADPVNVAFPPFPLAAATARRMSFSAKERARLRLEPSDSEFHHQIGFTARFRSSVYQPGAQETLQWMRGRLQNFFHAPESALGRSTRRRASRRGSFGCSVPGAES